jgi:hypothetical protein
VTTKKKNAFIEGGAIHRVRLGHVNRLLLDRYGPELPDDDAGAEDLRILLHVKANAYRSERREKTLLNEIGLRAPWMPADKARLKPLKGSADWLGRALNVDCATRDRLGIWQIGAADLDAQARLGRNDDASGTGSESDEPDNLVPSIWRWSP